MKTLIGNCIGALRRNASGNLGLTFALSLPFVLGALGLAFDGINLVNSKRALQTGVDSAALAAVSALASNDKTTDNVTDYAKAFLEEELAIKSSSTELKGILDRTTVIATQKTVGTTRVYTVDMKSTRTVSLTPFSAFLGRKYADVSAVSSVKSSVATQAISLYLVVDRSGSMSWVTDTALSTPRKCQNYVTLSDWSKYPNLSSSSPCMLNKVGALKTAAASLFDKIDQIEALDASNTITRTGAVSFTDSQQTPSDIAWGTTDSRTYISALPAYPTGGTDMSDAMNTAYTALNSATETSAQASKGNTNIARYIVLMTDGENTGASSTHNTSLDTKTLAACTKAKNAGITIYTVAFMAPDLGKSLLLSCSGNSANSFTAESASQLIAAFDQIGKSITNRTTLITK